MNCPRLVLASASPRRLALLAQLGIEPTETFSPAIDESPLPRELPRPYVLRMARAKAMPRNGRFVLAADTAIACGRRILPKPATEEEAGACLDLLSGRRFRALTAVVAIAPDGRRAERLNATVLALAQLAPAARAAWLAGEDWRGRAGGFSIDGRLAGHLRFVSGSPSGVAGLPLFETAQLLRGLGFPLP